MLLGNLETANTLSHTSAFPVTCPRVGSTGREDRESDSESDSNSDSDCLAVTCISSIQRFHCRGDISPDTSDVGADLPR